MNQHQLIGLDDLAAAASPLPTELAVDCTLCPYPAQMCHDCQAGPCMRQQTAHDPASVLLLHTGTGKTAARWLLSAQATALRAPTTRQ